MNRKRINQSLRIGLGLALVFFAAALYIKRFELYDAWRLRNYKASPEIVALANSTRMSDYGRRLFYVNHPLIQDKANFVSNCGSREKTIVLGCYISGRGIYLLTVTDSRLDGVQQVTAAHEMLHAAWERLSAGDKKKITILLEEAYKSTSDQRIRDTIEQYRQNQADVGNELHSILGTEASQLTPDLEQYYRRYFLDRSAVVAFSARYEAVFTERKNQIEAYDKQLTQLEQQYRAASNGLDQQQSALISERARLNALLSAGERASYNAGVAPYNAKVQAYNSAVSKTNALVAQYKTILGQRNALAQETQEIVRALDSSINSRSTLQ